VLPASARLRRREEFTRTVRGGRKAARGAVVVHCLRRTPDATADGADSAGPQARSPRRRTRMSFVDAASSATETTRVGFVVPKSVGSAVVRNLVTRRLRHLVRPRLADLPPGTWVVVRALPSASEMSFDRLGADLDDALERAIRPRASSEANRRERTR
jgi:ribonuclease P protein component